MVFRLSIPLPLTALALVAGAAFCLERPASGAPVTPAPQSVSAIDRVWSSHRVGYAMVVTDTAIIVAYYDANRQLTVASRPRSAPAWVYHKLDSWTGWDSHNYIAMALDTLVRSTSSPICMVIRWSITAAPRRATFERLRVSR